MKCEMIIEKPESVHDYIVCGRTAKRKWARTRYGTPIYLCQMHANMVDRRERKTAKMIGRAPDESRMSFDMDTLTE